MRELTERQSLLFAHEVLPQLSQAGIELVLWDDIDDDERARRTVDRFIAELDQANDAEQRV